MTQDEVTSLLSCTLVASAWHHPSVWLAVCKPRLWTNRGMKIVLAWATLENREDAGLWGVERERRDR